MNMLGAATLDLVEHLRAITNGWRIEPMICKFSEDVRSMVNPVDIKPMVNPPAGVSLTNFFIDWMAKFENTICFIRVKIKTRELRFIECRLKENQVVLFYWAGQGWKQNQISCKSSLPQPVGIKTHRVVYDYQQYTVYQLFRINRIKKGKKNRGKKKPRKPNMIQIDRIELGDPSSTARVAMRAVATLKKSLDWNKKQPRRIRAIVLDGDDFTYDSFLYSITCVEYIS